jgi:hypothetical protein
MNDRRPRRGAHSAGLALLATLSVLAGCSNHPAELLGSASSADPGLAAAAAQEPPLPPIEGWEAPRIRLWTDDGFRRAQREGGVSLAPDQIWDLEVAAGDAVTFQWTARPRNGRAPIDAYRWALDLEDITDETPRLGPDDLEHWSQWSATETSATVGPFDAGEEHFFYVETRDRLGFFSLVTVRIGVAEANGTEGLLLSER